MNNRARIVLLGLFAVLVAVWGSSASLPSARSGDQAARRAGSDEGQPTPSLFDVDEASARIRRVQETSPGPLESGRNPFEFARPPARPASAVPAVPPADVIGPPPPSSPPPPLFTLSGIADRTGEDGKTVRTAIISGLDRLYFVKAGDTITTRYSVTAIGADAVELRDATTGETIRIALQ
jgi:hypothetical protein